MDSILRIPATKRKVDTPDYDDNLAGQIIGVNVAMAVIMIIGVALRVASRFIKKARLGLSDYLVILSLASGNTMMQRTSTNSSGLQFPGLGQNATFIWCAATGSVGYHLNVTSPEQIVIFQKAYFIDGTMQPPCLALAKLSILVLLLKIFKPIRKLRITFYILMVIVVLWFIGTFLACALICLPIESRWYDTVEGKCGNEQLVQYISPLPWVLTDFAILVAPMPAIKTLQLPRHSKIAVAALFSLGGLTCIMACVRYGCLWIVTDDITYQISYQVNLTAAEAGVTVLVASLVGSLPAIMVFVPVRLLSSLKSWVDTILPSSGRRSERTGKMGGEAFIPIGGAESTSSMFPPKRSNDQSEVSLKAQSHSGDLELGKLPPMPVSVISPTRFEGIKKDF